MTAKALASMLHARRIGRGRWAAKCPSHPDRRPSLSIAEGKKGVLVRCQSLGCTTAQICDALGISVSALFYDDGRSVSPAEMRRIEAQRQVGQRKESVLKRRRGAEIYQARYWEGEVRRLGSLLANTPEIDRLARQFHWALDRSRDAQAAICPYFHPMTVPGEYA